MRLTIWMRSDRSNSLKTGLRRVPARVFHGVRVPILGGLKPPNQPLSLALHPNVCWFHSTWSSNTIAMGYACFRIHQFQWPSSIHNGLRWVPICQNTRIFGTSCSVLHWNEGYNQPPNVSWMSVSDYKGWWRSFRTVPLQIRRWYIRGPPSGDMGHNMSHFRRFLDQLIGHYSSLWGIMPDYHAECPISSFLYVIRT